MVYFDFSQFCHGTSSSFKFFSVIRLYPEAFISQSFSFKILCISFAVNLFIYYGMCNDSLSDCLTFLSTFVFVTIPVSYTHLDVYKRQELG